MATSRFTRETRAGRHRAKQRATLEPAGAKVLWQAITATIQLLVSLYSYVVTPPRWSTECASAVGEQPLRRPARASLAPRNRARNRTRLPQPGPTRLTITVFAAQHTTPAMSSPPPPSERQLLLDEIASLEAQIDALTNQLPLPPRSPQAGEGRASNKRPREVEVPELESGSLEETM